MVVRLICIASKLLISLLGDAERGEVELDQEWRKVMKRGPIYSLHPPRRRNIDPYGPEPRPHLRIIRFHRTLALHIPRSQRQKPCTKDSKDFATGRLAGSTTPPMFALSTDSPIAVTIVPI